LGRNHDKEMAPSEAVLDFRVPPVPHVARAVRDGVAEFAQARGVGREDLGHFLSALGEALANAIEHSRATEPIAVQVRIDRESIVATIADNGVGFPVERFAEPCLPDPGAERGRGLPIMRRCCDIFSIQSERDKGTSIVLGRYFQAAAQPLSMTSKRRQPA
jgi:anti-sigma regulatory factor (Ser/Thr protein kinase)